MINWEKTTSFIHKSLTNNSFASEVLSYKDDISELQNFSHQVACSPIFVDKSYSDIVIKKVEEYHGILLQLVKHFKENDQVRNYFRINPDIETIVINETNPEYLCVARFDGYVDEKNYCYKILEHNADSPAGTFFTSKYDEAASKLTNSLLNYIDKERDGYGEAFIKVMLDEYSRFFKLNEIDARPSVLILQFNDKANKESQMLAQKLMSLGFKAVVADPRSIEFSKDGVYVDTTLVDLIWNKINVASWEDEFQGDVSVIKGLARQVSLGNVCLINSFSSRYIFENKLSLAIFQEEKFGYLLEDYQKQIILDILPWSRKLERNKSVQYKGKCWDIAALVLDNPSNFVIKQQFDIRGNGVTIGKNCSHAQWTEIVNVGFRKGYIVQEFIRPLTIPILYHEKCFSVEVKKFSLDSFIFAGKHSGFGCKASSNDKINIFQGGSKVPALVIP